MNSDSLRLLISNEINKIAFRPVSHHEPLLTSGILDSVTAVDLSILIEEESGIKVPFQEINEKNFATIDSIIAYLESRT
jgi:acyl carrier protein